MKAGCAQFGTKENSDEEITHIKSSILAVSDTSHVDARFILAIVLQESNGCVRVGTTSGKVRNPGLMQSHSGRGSCANDKQSSCPASEILLMIKDGTEGRKSTASGDGLMQCLAQNGGSGAAAYYKAARCYNSGSVPLSGNLGEGGSTPCYASDIANRLRGWSTGATQCKDDTVGNLNGSQHSDNPLASGSQGSSSNAIGTSKSTPAVLTTFLSSPFSSVATSSQLFGPSSTECVASGFPTTSASSTQFPVYPHVISTCRGYATVRPGDHCDMIEMQNAISASDFRQWNPGLDTECTNLWSGYRYCIRA